MIRDDKEWRDKLSPEEYYVTRQCGTERPFTGKYYKCDDKGTYECVCCGNGLFSSDTKFESGTGWPSFYAPVDEKRLSSKDDDSLGTPRVEITCSKCDAHLGHVFPDGPNPTGMRYCVNSASLRLKRDQ